jgi:histidinol-phosphate aminotransferase
MFIQRKRHLRDITRFRVSEGRDLVNGLRLDRNERVEAWPPGFLAEIFKATPDYFLSCYPETGTLYTILAKHLSVSEDQLLLGSGIDGIIKALFEVMTSPGDEIAVLAPSYAMYHVYSNIFQTKLVEVSYDQNLQLDRAKLNQVIDRKPTMLFLPNPNQPVESALSLAELEDLAQRTLRANCLFVVDEAYFLFGCDTAISLVNKYENVVILRTLSKGFGIPAIRLGYMVTNADNMNVLSKTRFAHESNGLSCAVAEYLLDHYELITNYVEKVKQGRDFTQKKLAALDLKTHGSKGNFLLIDLHTKDCAAKVVAQLKEQKIYVKGPWSAPFDKYITVSVGPEHLMQRFVDAIGQIKKQIGF